MHRLGRRGRVARAVNRGEVWFTSFAKPDKSRPVVVISRQEMIGLLHTVMVAPVTSTSSLNLVGFPGESNRATSLGRSRWQPGWSAILSPLYLFAIFC